MSYGRDNSRGLHGNTIMGDDRSAEGMIPATLDFKNARQSVPDRDLHGDGVFNAASAVSGPKELLGQDPHEGIKDDNYPSLPNPGLPGNATTNAGDQGFPVNFDAVAPYEYSEFPKDSYTSGGGKAAVPLT